MSSVCQIIIGLFLLFFVIILKIVEKEKIKSVFQKPWLKIAFYSFLLTIAIMLIVNALFFFLIKHFSKYFDSYLESSDTISLFLSVFISLMIAYFQYRIEYGLRKKNDYSYFDEFRKSFLKSKCLGLYNYSVYNNRFYDLSSWFALVIKFQDEGGFPFLQSNGGRIQQYKVRYKVGNGNSKALIINTYNEIVLPLDNNDNISDFFLRGLYPNRKSYSNSKSFSGRSNSIEIELIFKKCPGVETDEKYTVAYTLIISIINGYNEDRVLPLEITSVSMKIK